MTWGEAGEKGAGERCGEEHECLRVAVPMPWACLIDGPSLTKTIVLHFRFSKHRRV